MIDEVEQSENRNDEYIVEFLELSGFQEGLDFCYDSGEFFIPENLEFGDKVLPIDVTKFPSILKLESIGEDVLVHFIDKDTVEKSVTLPYTVHQLMAHLVVKRG